MARVTYPDIEAMYRGLERTRYMFKGNVQELVDGYRNPLRSGFRELSLVVEHSGHMCQLHLNTFQMVGAEHQLGARAFELQDDIERAAREGNFPGCESLLRWGDQLGIQLASFSTFRGLHHAAARGHAGICCALLDHGANVNALDATGNSSLHLAAKGGHDNVVWALLDRGRADCLLTNSRGESPLVEAVRLLHLQPDNQRARDTVLTLAYA
eukprot:CAMPEP_0169281632 /NCGR_PEP_ID=MMETSP1016-20121227/56377_1 /TAXON_ID=342587 /ORGANISM="Karlodinium micrum, Strain CCMP2283" /LENGTH=211 /DNA_ID=CAMNT_0009370303 /DNA_START=9 /DNA_END=641 /DNA_ORIENTATION=+